MAGHQPFENLKRTANPEATAKAKRDLEEQLADVRTGAVGMLLALIEAALDLVPADDVRKLVEQAIADREVNAGLAEADLITAEEAERDAWIALTGPLAPEADDTPKES